MIPLIFLAATIIGAVVHLFVSKRPRTSERVIEVFLLYFLVVGMGVTGLFAASGHLFRPDEIAEEIGWPAGNPFQREVGLANLGIGVAGVLCAWLRGGFWAATTVTASIYLFGDGIGHIIEERQGDHAEYNAGPILYTDFIFAIVTTALMLLWSRATRWWRSDRRDVETTPELARA